MSLSVIASVAKLDNLKTFNKMLSSVAFADELIIFAMFDPSEKLKKLAKKFHAKLVKIAAPKVVEEVRSQQVKAASSDWALIMDFDEIIPNSLKKEITNIVKSDDSHSAYAILRKNYSLGKSLKRGGWGDDFVVRLFKLSEFVTWPHNIHSTPRVQGTIGKLSCPMEHHKDESLESMIEKTNRYSEAESDLYLKGNLPKVNKLTLLRKMVMETIRRGILKQGILDSDIGIIQSIYQGFSVFVSYAKLYEKQNK